MLRFLIEKAKQGKKDLILKRLRRDINLKKDELKMLEYLLSEIEKVEEIEVQKNV